MGVVLLLARGELRRRWAAILLLGLLAGVVGGVVLGAATGARRTGTAFDRLAERSGAPDATVLLVGRRQLLDEILAAPEVGEAWPAHVSVGRDRGVEEVRYLAVLAGPTNDTDLQTPVITEGRAPDDRAEDELLISETLSKASGYGVGDTIDLAFLSASQFFSWGAEELGEPRGPELPMRVVGVVRTVEDADTGSLGLYGTAKWYERYRDEAGGGESVFVRLVDRPGALADFRDRVDQLERDSIGTGGNSSLDPVIFTTPADARRDAADATGVLVTGLLAFAVAAGVAGVVALAQAMGRHHDRRAVDRPVYAALGLTSAQRVAAAVVPGALAGLVAAAVAAGVAVLASPLTPIGSARQMEPDLGVDVNVAFLAVGALVVALATVGLLAVTATWSDRRAARLAAHPASPSASVSRLAALGVPPVAVMGARLALEPGSGRRAVPVRSALIGTIVSVAGVTAALAFGASLDRLVGTPTRYGWTVDFAAELAGDTRAEEMQRFVEDPRVAAAAEVETAAVSVGGHRTSAYALDVQKGTVAPTLLDGRLPASPDEIALGPELLDDLDAEPGDRVAVETADGQALRLQVVGEALSPGIDGESFAAAAFLTGDGLERVRRTEPFVTAFVTLADGVDRDAYVGQVASELEVFPDDPPPEVRHLAGVRRLPFVLAGFLALLAATAVGHALVVAVRRRRHDLAVVRALGFTRGQSAATIAAMATTTLLLGLAIGVPVGIIGAGALWARVAGDASVQTDLLLPVVALALIGPAALLVGNAIAAFPARAAAWLHPAEALRTE